MAETSAEPTGALEGSAARANPVEQFWRLWRQGQRPDVGPFLDQAGTLTPPQIAALLRLDQCERWRLGQRRPAEDYLALFPALQADIEYAVELIYGEFLLREELGEEPTAAEYLARFPPYAARLRQQFDLHEALAALPEGAARPSQAARELGSAWPTNVPEAPPAAPNSPALPGYEILGELGRGGMGVVYKARQRSLQRVVALKMILAGGQAGPEHHRRFRTEAEAVARLQHPHIVQIYEIGEHEGLPYLALEYVEGGSLARQLDGTPLPPEPAARLVETLARAMQAAHDKGIVHRDLKPANVLLTADGAPKVTDFGLAKKLDESAGPTASGAILGTPSYMAPEQAGGASQAVGAAADVYALGAILYECLTGRPPFKATSPLETLQQVAHEEPVPPRQLQPALPRDLETVCLKCLRKEPARRYATAADLAEDLRRYQAGEPIRARPVGMVERGWKWTRRRPAVAALVGVSVVAVTGGVAGALWYAQQQRDQANQERALRQEAADQREQARAVLGFFQERVLAAARPQGKAGGLGKDVTIRAAVDAAEPTIAEAFADQPTVAATIRNALGTTYWHLGEPLLAIRQFEQAVGLRRQVLGPDHDDTLASINNLALAYQDAGRFADALPLLEETLAKLRTRSGPNHPSTLTVMKNVALVYRAVGRLDDALPLAQEVLKSRRALNGPDHEETLEAMNHLAWIYKAAGQFDHALPLYEECVRRAKVHLGPNHPNTLRWMNNLAQAYRAANRLADALPLLEAALTGLKQIIGPAHPETLMTMDNLASAYQAAGRLADALPLFEEALKGFKAKLPPDHPDTLICMRSLAGAYLAANQADKALPMLHDYLVAQRHRLGPNDPHLAGLLAAVGQDLLKYGHPAEAEPVLRECLALRAQHEPDAWTTFNAQSLLGGALLGRQSYAEAELLLRRGYEGMKQREAEIPTPGKARVTEALERLVQLYDAWGKPEQAREWRQKLEQAKTPKRAPKN